MRTNVFIGFLRVLLPLLLALTAHGAAAQSCSGGEKDRLVHFFTSVHGLDIYACIHGATQPNIGAHQDVSWGIINTRSDTFEVAFTKVYTFRNGAEIRKKFWVPVTVVPDETAYGGNFSGDLDLNDNFFKEDCDCPGEFKRIKHLAIEDVAIVNVAERRRQQEQEEQWRQAVQRAEEERRAKAEQEQKEDAQRDEEARQAEEERSAREHAAADSTRAATNPEEAAKEEKTEPATYAPPPPTANELRYAQLQDQAADRQLQEMAYITGWTGVAGSLLFLEFDDGEGSYFRGGGFHIRGNFGVGLFGAGHLPQHEYNVKDFDVYYNGGFDHHVHEESEDSSMNHIWVPGFCFALGMDLFHSRNFSLGVEGRYNGGVGLGGLLGTNVTTSSTSSVSHWSVIAKAAMGSANIKLLAGYGMEQMSVAGSSVVAIDEYLGTTDPGVTVEDYLSETTDVTLLDVRYVKPSIGTRFSWGEQLIHVDIEYNWVLPRDPDVEDHRVERKDAGMMGMSLAFTRVNRMRFEVGYSRLKDRWWTKEPASCWTFSLSKQLDYFSRKYSKKGVQYVSH